MTAIYYADAVAEPLRGARNMAVDHALLEQTQRDQLPILRLYRWQPACLSFGRNQSARGIYDGGAAAQRGIEIVRRPTGGLAVLHDRELTYAFCAPAPLLDGPRNTYVTVNRALVSAFRQLGVPAELSAGRQRSRFGTVQSCFAEPAAGEVVANGLKLVGSAQRCERHTILQHGSILLEHTQTDVARISSAPFDMSGRATNVHALLGEVPPLGALIEAIVAGFKQVCGICLAPAQLAARTEARARELERLYASAEWTWRR